MNCYYCGKWFGKKKDAVEHTERFHANNLEADGLDACQALYLTTHPTLNGECMCGCGKKTEWNKKTGKPFKVSPDPSCRARLKKIAEANLIRATGMDQRTLMSDMEHQREMQKNRKITGKYTFKTDGGVVEYMGKLELSWLRFCDTILDLPSNAIQDPPKNFRYYDSKAQKERVYMPDFYMPDYNLIVEIKDGGDHPNGNQKFNEETKYKVAMKDEAMKKQNEFNYIRISGTNYGPFMEALYQIVHEQSGDEKKRKAIIVITESACIDPTETDTAVPNVVKDTNPDQIKLMVGYIPGMSVAKFIAITDSKYLSYWYVTDMNTGLLTRKVSTDWLDDGYDYRMYKYIPGNPKVNINDFDNLFYAIFNCVNTEFDNQKNIVELLGSISVDFDDGISVRNNNRKQTDFMLIEEYFYEEEDENE